MSNFSCFGKCSKVLIQVKLDFQIVASFGLTCCLSKIFHEKKEDKRELMTYRIEPLVRVAIGDIDRPTRCRNMSDNTGTPRNANFSLLTHFLHSGIDIDIKQIGHCKMNQMYEKKWMHILHLYLHAFEANMYVHLGSKEFSSLPFMNYRNIWRFPSLSVPIWAGVKCRWLGCTKHALSLLANDF